MKKIYLVTEGEYSDYHVVGAFSTEKKAQEYIDWAKKVEGENSLSYIDIEEYPIDSKEMPEKVYYRVEIKEYTEPSPYQTQTWCRILREKPETLGIVTSKFYEDKNFLKFNCTTYSVNVYTDSYERAVKIGNEKIRKFQAENL